MLPEAVTVAVDLDDNGVMEEPIEECRCDYAIPEDLAPLGKAPVAGQYYGTLFVAGVDELKEQVRATAFQRQIAHLVDDQKGVTGKEPDTLGQRAFPFSLKERGDDLGQGGQVDAFARLDGLDPQGDRQMGLACARGPEEVDHFFPVDEAQLGQRQYLIAIDRRLEREVILLKRLNLGEPGGHQRHLDPSVLPRGEFLTQEQIERLKR